jgi:hypothetical protein
MKIFVLIIAMAWASLLASGQNTPPAHAVSPPALTVRGVVVDSATGGALALGTITLQNAKTKQRVRSVLTKEDGSFTLAVPAGIACQIVLTFSGHNGKILTLTGPGSDASPDMNMGRIALAPATKELAEFQVTAVKPLIKQEVDRLTYNVQSDPESPVLSALDMMRKVPLLTVDASDNILLKGSGNFKILINGKESGLLAKNPSDILKAMPATNIDRIEVITTPPAKYDAEGLAGIINIVTKRDLPHGYNLGLNGRINNVLGSAVNLNGTFKQGPFGLAAFAGVGQFGQPAHTSGNTQNFLEEQSVLTQNISIHPSSGSFNYAEMEMSYEFDSLNLLTAAIDANSYKSPMSSDQYSALTNNEGGTDQYYHLQNDADNRNSGFDASLNYQLGFKRKKGQLLTLSYKYTYAPNTQVSNNAFSQRLNYPALDVPDYNQYDQSGMKVHTFQLDYEQPVKELTIEAGAKAILRENFSNYHIDDLDSASGQYFVNPDQTNDFTYNQDVYSLYNSYELRLENWAVKSGLRVEHTRVDADFSSTGSAVSQDYNNFIPSIAIQRKFKTSSINFGFTDRIQRPGIYQLNPFVDRSNPSYLSFGNPDLRPQLNHTFELSYRSFAKSSISAGISYAFSTNSIQSVSGLQIIQAAGKNDTVTSTTFENLGKNSTLGFNINTTQNFTKDLTLSANGQFNHIWLEGAYNGQLYKNQGNSANLFANLGWTFGKGYRLGLNAGYFSGNVTLQGSTGHFLYTSPVISKTFLKKMATLAIAVNNPFSSYQVFRSSTTTPQYVQSSFNQAQFRSFALRFNYRFGKLTSDIKKNKHGINNDDTKEGEKAATN